MKLFKELFAAFSIVASEKNSSLSGYGNNRMEDLNLKRPINPSLENLRNNIFAKDVRRSMKKILFVAPSRGNGVSALVSEFSQNLSSSSNCRVLIINADLHDVKYQCSIHRESYYGKLNLKNESKVVHYKIEKTDTRNLWILNFDKNEIQATSLFEAECFKKLLSRVNKLFDYVVLDGPAVNKYPDSLLLCQLADGVVLVVEAGKTKKEIAQIAKKRLESAGANLLGVVLNKRVYFIPEYIYTRI